MVLATLFEAAVDHLLGLGAAQFALPGAVDRLRAERVPVDGPTVLLLAASDPANPYGSTLGWPRSQLFDARFLTPRVFFDPSSRPPLCVV